MRSEFLRERKQQDQPERSGLIQRYKKLQQEHPVFTQFVKTAAKAAVVYAAAYAVIKIWDSDGRPEVPIIKKRPEGDLAYWLGIPHEGWAEIRDDLSPLEEKATRAYLDTRVKTGRPLLSFIADIPYPIATFAAVKRKLQLPKQPK